MIRDKYTVLWIPKSGLFFNGESFQDGRGDAIRWNRKIPIYASHARAETAKKRIMERYPDAQGELVMLNVEIQEIAEESGMDNEV